MNYFEPSVAKAREYRMAMDDALWSSVRDLLEDEVDPGGIEDNPGRDGGTGRPTNLLDYAAYFDLELTPPALEEVPAEAKASATAHLLRRLSEIGSLDVPPSPLRITNFSRDFYSGDELERMARWWDIEPENYMGMIGARDDEFERSSRAIGLAMDYLHDCAPEMHGEVQTIVRDVVFSRQSDEGIFNYSGASSFALWGALTINAETQREWPQLYRQIVHETGHNLLFGIAKEEILVTDDPVLRTRSPIRKDPRPMDGVYHAAFVSAREAYAFDALLIRHEETGCLSGDDPEVIEDLLELSVLAFWDGVETLRESAALSGLGKAVLDDCEAYMSASFAVQPG